MRRPDLGAGFDGWQVVDPTPQERSAGGSLPRVSLSSLRVNYIKQYGYIKD